MRVGGINSSIMSIVNPPPPPSRAPYLIHGAIEHIPAHDVATAAAGIGVFAFVPVRSSKGARDRGRLSHRSEARHQIRFQGPSFAAR